MKTQIYALVCCIATVVAFEIFRQKNLKIDRFDGKCAHEPNMTLYLKDLRISLVKKVTVINSKLIAEKDFSNDLKLELKLVRCKSKEAADSCENYQKLKLNRLCDMLKGKSGPWAPFLEKISPPFNCPIKAGTYMVNNGSFDASALSAMPFLNENWYWKIESVGFDDVLKEKILCVYVETQIVHV